MTSELEDSFEIATPAASAPVPCEFLCGIAGTGKTYSILRQCEADPDWGILCATTGIAAVNLSAVTINSTLGYFDTDSLRDSYILGALTRRLHTLAQEHRRLVIDEISMMAAEQLDLIYNATQEANALGNLPTPLRLVLVGDFAQLPPIKARWAFEADCWGEFQAHATKLTKVWRQDQVEFLQALNFARCGQGAESAEALSAVGVEWHTALDLQFDGTTILPKNDQVDRYNQAALARLAARSWIAPSRRWGKQRREWDHVPPELTLKTGAYVMILANDTSSGDFLHANGDCGHIVDYSPVSGFRIRLVRNGSVVTVGKLIRDVSLRDKPDGWRSTETADGYYRCPHRQQRKPKRYVLGQVEYYPLRLAYASTVHKVQGLSLDRIQVDIRDRFFSAPSMCYVALSRCRTLQGLHIVGQRERFVSQCRTDPRIQQWL